MLSFKTLPFRAEDLRSVNYSIKYRKKYKGSKVLVKECQVLKDSMSFILNQRTDLDLYGFGILWVLYTVEFRTDRGAR